MSSRLPPAGATGEPKPGAAREPALTVDERPATPTTGGGSPRPASADRIAAGDVIDDRYEVLRELGRGGMGRVLACRDRKLGREVALKIIRVTAEEDGLLRFQLEARSTAALHHPNVVAVFDTGTHVQLPYLATELLEGQTLRQRLDKGRLGAREAAGIAVQIAKGLSAAHAQGVVHRDLKPENVFLCDDGWTKLLDFGIAKLLSPEGTNHPLATPTPAGETPSPTPRTEAGRILGTAGYMSPEQVRGHEIERRADLFALGAVLYEMLTGQRAFKGNTQVETMYAVLHSQPAPLPRELPQRLRELVTRCLAKLPEGRPASADEVVHLLEPIAAHLPVAPVSLAPSFAERRSVRFASAALALFLLAFAGLLYARRRHNAAPAERTIAVLPFTVRGAEREAYLGDGMVDLLSMSLSTRFLRTVDPHSLLGSLAKVPRPIDLSRGQELAKQLGATEFILGTVIESQGELRVQAALYSVGDLRAPLREAHADGTTHGVFQLVDELTTQLRGLPVLGQEKGGAGELQAKLAQLTTESPEALAAYLRGEALSRHGQDSLAAEAFKQAIALDDKFALAQYRLAVVTTVNAPALSRASLERALAPGTRLPERYQQLARAFLGYEDGRFDDAERGYRGYLRSHPEDVWAWLNLGETLFHLGPLHGRLAQESEQAFQQTLLLDASQQGDPLGHLLDLAQLGQNRELIATLASRYLAQAVEAEAITMPIRWIRAWAAGDGDEQKQLIERLATPATAMRDLRVGCLRALFAQDPESCVAMAEAALRANDPAKQVNAWRMLAVVALMRGRPQEALAQLRRVRELTPSGGQYPLEPLWLASLDFVPLTQEQLLALLAEARTLPAPMELVQTAQLHYLSGVVLLRAGQPDAALAEAVRLEQLPSVGGSINQDLALGLRARVLMAREKPDEALAALEKQELRVPLVQTFALTRIAEPHLRATLAARKGDFDRALLLEQLVSFYNQWEPVFRPPAALERARLFERRGDREHAVEEYERFASAWASCEPALRPALDEARGHLVALRSQLSASSRK